jgi:hypothetical protein
MFDAFSYKHIKGRQPEYEKPKTVFKFLDRFGGEFDKDYYQFVLSKDESELRVRILD